MRSPEPSSKSESQSWLPRTNTKKSLNTAGFLSGSGRAVRRGFTSGHDDHNVVKLRLEVCREWTCAAARNGDEKRRQECRRGRQECLLHGTSTNLRITQRGFSFVQLMDHPNKLFISMLSTAPLAYAWGCMRATACFGNRKHTRNSSPSLTLGLWSHAAGSQTRRNLFA
jgi:hypothetical protein